LVLPDLWSCRTSGLAGPLVLPDLGPCRTSGLVGPLVLPDLWSCRTYGLAGPWVLLDLGPCRTFSLEGWHEWTYCLSGFLKHCNGAEGTLNSGDLLQIQTRSSGKGGKRRKPSTHPTLETNKSTHCLTVCLIFFNLIIYINISYLMKN
jgi:hypothetical protein